MSESIKAFDEVAANYEDWYRQPRGAQVFLSELTGLKALLPSSGVGAEIGAGTGIFAENLTSEERRVICLDPSPKMLEQAAAKGLDSLLATAEDCPLRIASLDFAFMVVVLEFLPDPVKALTSLGSALKKCAPIVVLTVNRESPWGELYIRMGKEGDPVFSHARIYRLDEVVSFLNRAGFEVLDTIGVLATGPEEPEYEPKLVAAGLGAGAVLVKAVRKR